jgi:hypothetical protein
MMTEGEQDKRLMQIVGRTWSDEPFRRRLMADAAAVLRAEGIFIPAGVQVRVMEDTSHVMNLILPVRAVPDGELSDDDLDKISGGGRKSETAKSIYS